MLCCGSKYVRNVIWKALSVDNVLCRGQGRIFFARHETLRCDFFTHIFSVEWLFRMCRIRCLVESEVTRDLRLNWVGDWLIDGVGAMLRFVSTSYIRNVNVDVTNLIFECKETFSHFHRWFLVSLTQCRHEGQSLILLFWLARRTCFVSRNSESMGIDHRN